jgi:hypothetical protein
MPNNKVHPIADKKTKKYPLLKGCIFKFLCININLILLLNVTDTKEAKAAPLMPHIGINV